MALFVQAKRVSSPLDDAARARLRGELGRSWNGSADSGGDHETTSLSGLVHSFLETDGSDSASSDAASVSGGDSDEDADEGSSRGSAEMVRDMLSRSAGSDCFHLRLRADVCDAAGSLAALLPSGPSYRRSVAARLSAKGYNAGVCKSTWETNLGVAAGSYEYIDVVVGKEGGRTEQRYVVDLDFAAQFEVARPTEEYAAVVEALPRVAVVTPEEMRRLVSAMADAARRSLRRRGMHVPPWRKSGYMLAKWLGPFSRATSPVPPAAAAVAAGCEVKCRSVGFQAAPPLLVSPATRTR